MLYNQEELSAPRVRQRGGCGQDVTWCSGARGINLAVFVCMEHLYHHHGYRGVQASGVTFLSLKR